MIGIYRYGDWITENIEEEDLTELAYSNWRKSQERIAELEQQLSTLREAAQAVVDSEGVVYPIPASHSYKVATLKAALEVDNGS